MAIQGDVTFENDSSMTTITKGNSWQHQWNTSAVSGDTRSSNNGVMMRDRRQAWPDAPIIQSSHHPRWWEQPSSSSNPQPDITSEEHLKTLSRILSTWVKNFSRFHLSEFALYEFVETHTFSACTPEGRRNFQRTNLIPQWVGFDPPLPHTFILSHYGRDRIQGPPV